MRRNTLSEMTLQEEAIYDAILAVETLPADYRLTNCVMKLQEAKNHLGNYVDDIDEKPKNNLTFGQAIEALKQGKRIARQGWNGKGMFVFMQVPAVINKEIVPKMQSLPQSVKDEFERRFNDPSQQINAIYYDNQMAIVNTSNVINGWSPSVSDSLAEDWVVLD